MKLTIDGQTVAARSGESVLRCALRHGIEIPHLCSHPTLPAFGACRLCIVEIDGIRGYPASCATPAIQGMVVRTNTEALKSLRHGILQLILLEHPSSCLVCDKHELCDEFRPTPAKAGRTVGCHTCNNKEVCDVRVLADEMGLTDLPVPPTYRGFALERSDPFIDRDLNLCILCGRCVRICKAHQGQSAIEFIGRGSQARIGEAFGRSLAEAGCQFCGSCIDVCPTGSLSDRYAKWTGAPRRFTATTCTLCDAACAVTVHSSARRKAVMARGTNARVPVCLLGRFAIPEFLNGGDRLTVPRIRVGERLREVSWAQAVSHVCGQLKSYSGGAFALVCDTTSTLEDRHAFRKFTYEVMRSPHYIEIRPDALGVSRADLPTGVKAALLTGDFVAPERLASLELLILQDSHRTEASERATVSLPAAVLFEVAGTWVDGNGLMRPLRKACEPPRGAKPDWQIVCEIARVMGASGFDFESAAAIARALGAVGARLRIRGAKTAPAATDRNRRRTHFRGHRLEDHVGGLRELPIPRAADTAAASGEAACSRS